MTQLERRDWAERPDEVERLRELRAELFNRNDDVHEYANLLARHAVRLELIALRRRMEEWAAQPLTRYEESVDILVDVATVLDERISDVGGEERP